ncbi:unnamed protein product [Echinostoma caproni]|uniref:GMC_OxRdtase_N domain-containing protein n=1 Tax=Echinostoma caproni TaxID=27848 RepID=A0A183BGS8_9TREM|nr:unnamed protein product [Echinostoma caproni]
MKPYQVEILTFQRSSKSTSYADLLNSPGSLTDQSSRLYISGAGSGTATNNGTPGINVMQISDRLELCLGSKMERDPLIRGYMSTSVPRVELILKTAVLNNSQFGEPATNKPVASDSVNSNLAIEYSFVTGMRAFIPYLTRIHLCQ